MFRLILGPSGSGKTTSICKEIIARSLKEPSRHFFILVPDQFTMQTQMDVVRMHPGKGIMNIDVLSFSRLIHRVFDETGAPRERLLDDLGKSLLLRRTAQSIGNELSVIGSGMNRAGYADEVKSVISEFMQYNISPDALDTFIEQARDRTALQARLADLQKLYRAFLEMLSEKYLTSEELLSVCAGRIPQSKLFQDAVIAVDGFTGFTPVQYILLRALYAHAKEMTFSFTLRKDGLTDDTEDSDAVEKTGLPKEDTAQTGDSGMFALTYKTIADLTRHMWEEEGLMNPGQTPPLDVWSEYRASHAGDVFLGQDSGAFLYKNADLIHLEKNLFAHPSLPFHEDAAGISLMCASDIQEEIRQTFRAIHAKLRQDAALMYRDFAIVCADLTTYGDYIEQTADMFEIPVFRDQTRSIIRNPLFEYLRSVLEIQRTSFDTDAVFQYLRSGLVPYTFEEINLLETYATSRRIRGKKAWNKEFVIPFQDNIKRSEEMNEKLTKRAEAIRKRVSEALAGISEAFAKKKGAAAVTKEMFLLMEKDGIPEKLGRYEEEFLSAGQDAEASEYGQIYSKVVSLLEALFELLGEDVLKPREYAEILEAGFSEIKVGTIPQNVDRVQIGDLERTRLRDVKYLFFAGVHDGVIPGSAAGSGILSELDREFLRKACPDVELAPTPQELMNRQRLYLYMTMTKPVSGLTVSYPKQNGEGKSLRPAYIITRLQKMFPRISVRHPEKDTFTEQTETKGDLYERLSPLFSKYAAGLLKDEDEKKFRDMYAALYQSDPEGRGRLAAGESAAFIRYQNTSLGEELAKALYAPVKMNSVSRLEMFASCAYKHFIAYGLRLAEKATGDFGSATLGTVYHDVLEAFGNQLDEEGLSWKEFTSEQAEHILTKLTDEYVSKHNPMLNDNSKGRFEILRIRRILYRSVMTLQYQLKKGDFVPLFAEQSFYKGNLRGRIDRCDVASDDTRDLIKIIDYKSGRKDFDVTLMYHGLQMQLITYMDAALKSRRASHTAKEQVPAALLYYRVADPLINGDDKNLTPTVSAAEVTALRQTALRATGLVNGDDDILHKLDKDMETKSDVIPVTKTKSGFSKESNVFETGEYELLSEYVDGLEGELSGRVADGDIAVNPVLCKSTDACTYCRYRSVCGYDIAVPGYQKNNLPETDMQSVLEIIKDKKIKM